MKKYIRTLGESVSGILCLAVIVFIPIRYGASSTAFEACSAKISMENLLLSGQKYVLIDLRKSATASQGVIPLQFDSWNDGFDAIMQAYEPNMIAVLICDPHCTGSYDAYQRLRQEIPFLKLLILDQ